MVKKANVNGTVDNIGLETISNIEDINIDSENLKNGDVLSYNAKEAKWENNSSLHTYSTEEQIVGKWIDGKPIYEQVINIENMLEIKSNTWTELPNFPENVKCIIYFVGIQYDGNVYNTWNLNVSSGGDVVSYRQYSLGINQYIIQYTKTTD